MANNLVSMSNKSSPNNSVFYISACQIHVIPCQDQRVMLLKFFRALYTDIARSIMTNRNSSQNISLTLLAVFRTELSHELLNSRP